MTSFEGKQTPLADRICGPVSYSTNKELREALCAVLTSDVGVDRQVLITGGALEETVHMLGVFDQLYKDISSSTESRSKEASLLLEEIAANIQPDNPLIGKITAFLRMIAETPPVEIDNL